MGPEPAPVLADAPALLLEPALGRGDAERLLGQSHSPILFRIKTREVAADDLGGGIALGALGAGVPARHPSLGVEPVDGVVGDALHQQPELLLALAQGLVGPPAFGDVAGDLGEADQPPLLVADGVDDHVGPEPNAVLADPPALLLEPALGFGDAERLLGRP